MRERKTVVMLPTSEASSRLCKLSYDDKIGMDGKSSPNGFLIGAPNNDAFIYERKNGSTIEPQHLYILSNEYKRVPIGTWLWNDEDNSIYQTDIDDFDRYHSDYIYEIIATTDSKLHTYNAAEAGNKGNSVLSNCYNIQPTGIARIPTDFIQAYIKAYNEGSPIKEIMLEMEDVGYCCWNVPENCVCEHRGRNFKNNGFNGKQGITKVKLRSDGTIIIHPLKERLFTMAEVVKIFADGRNATNYQVVDIQTFIEKNYPS